MSEKNINWQKKNIETVIKQTGTDPINGLSSAKALEFLNLFGKNIIPGEEPVSAVTIFFNQFKSVLVIILILAALFSLLLGHGVEAGAIFFIVLFSATFGFVQEYRAEKALSSMKKIATPVCVVVRDGKLIQIKAEDLVFGDMVRVTAGDIIAADLRLIESMNLKVDESFLTGESVAVEKNADTVLETETSLGDKVNCLFSGSNVVYGRGLGVVVAGGADSELGKLANLLQKTTISKTPLQKSLENLGKILGWIALGVVVLIVVLGFARGLYWVDIILFGISLAVAVVPEALPAVITISLALGIKRMLKRNALARYLPVVEALGSVSVICTDKTGTLTKNQMTVQSLWVPESHLKISGQGYEPTGNFSKNGSVQTIFSQAAHDLFLASCLCNDAQIIKSVDQWELVGDPTEGALLVMAMKAGLTPKTEFEKYPRIAEEPFSSETKRMVTVHNIENVTHSYIKGSLESVLDLCSHIVYSGQKVSLSLEQKQIIHRYAETQAALGERIIAFGVKKGSGLQDFSNAEFLGMVSMSDPAREEAKPAVAKCQAAGIKVVMITGDHPLTAKTIAQELGILTSGKLVSGSELEKMSQETLLSEIDKIQVFARVNPSHKLRIIESWQLKGEVVAMTGDGVNDAPALKKADVGIAMGIAGTEVAKEAAGMTLLDDNFASIIAAIEEGREIFQNIKKYLMYLLSSHLGEVILIGSALLLGMPLPLTAVQILFINLAVDGPPALALSMEPASGKAMSEPPRSKTRGIFTRQVTSLMLSAALWSTVVNGSIFYLGLWEGKGLAVAGSMTFFSLILIQFFKAYSMRFITAPINFKELFNNKWLNYAIFAQLPLLFLFPNIEFFRQIFGIAGLNFYEWAIVFFASASIIPFLEAVKYYLNHTKKSVI